MLDAIETCELTEDKEHGINHVVHLNVIGLTGIILDSAKTKETVSKDKDMLVPPRQMKASLVVIRNDRVYGMSSLSKGLVQSSTAQNSNESKENATRKKQRRYLAVWNRNKKSSENSSILFEAELSENSSCAPHKNFDVFIGLTACVDTETMTIPIGVASLPLAEAAVAQGPSGKVVLDLPVHNISPIQAVSTNAFKKGGSENGTSDESKKKQKRGLFSSFRRRQMAKETADMEPVVPNVQFLKRPCVYTLDSSQEDPSILRVELELQRKELNVEIGISKSSYPVPLLANECNSKFIPSNDLVENIESDYNYPAKNMDFADCHSRSMEQFFEGQSFERVLSIRTKPTNTVKSRFQFNPTRPFRVKCIDQTTSKFQLTPVKKEYDGNAPFQASPSFLQLLEEMSSHEEDGNENIDFVDVSIERVLSEPPIVDDGSLMATLAQSNEEYNSVYGNENCDEQSFLSRDTTAFKSEKKKLSTKIFQLDIKSEVSTKHVKIPLFWRRGKSEKSLDAGNLPSVAGTESSNHSSSNSESSSGSIVRNSELDELNVSRDQLISVSSNSELICESPRSHSSQSVKIPVSILRTPSTLKHKAKDSVSPLSLTSVEQLQDADVFDTPEVKTKDSFSVVSSSADTAIFAKHRVKKDINCKETIDEEVMSPYSDSLPHFVEETAKPIVLREKYEFDDDNDILKQKQRTTHSKVLTMHGTSCNPGGTFTQHETSNTSRTLTHNLYQFIELQPCAGKIEPLLAIDDEDSTMAESWTQNENSTLGTYVQPKGTMHDDIADLGLLFDDMCRQSGFRTMHDDCSSVDDDGTARETVTASLLDRNGGKQRWVTALNGSAWSFVDSNKRFKEKAAHSPSLANTDDESDIEEQSFKFPPSERSNETSANEGTQRSSTGESASVLSEQGTEVDVNGVNLILLSPKVVDPPTFEEAKIEKVQAIKMKPSSRPPKDPNRTKILSQTPLYVNAKTKSHISDESNGSRNESLSPSRKSIAQSFVDFVEYVITPSPSSTPTLTVPTLLNGDDAASVGELTATTYERQVDVDEMRRQSAQQSFLLADYNVHSLNDTYFSEYDGGISPEIAAAIEAATVKKIAENLVGNPL